MTSMEQPSWDGQDVADDFDRVREEREATQRAIRHVIDHALHDEPTDQTPQKRGLYEDLTIRDRSRSKAQSRLIGGIGGWYA